jgi:hypothetical protein
MEFGVTVATKIDDWQLIKSLDPGQDIGDCYRAPAR